jgi:molybdenum cofactor guanylyltransferase
LAIRNNDHFSNVSFVIQAGGLSSRMGTDKGLVLLQDKPLVAWILDQLTRFDSEKIIITNNPTPYNHFGVPVYEDVIPGIGALGGLLSAITFATHELIFVLACDMPFLDLSMLDLMLDLADQHDVVIPRLGNPENTEPFRALYRKTCLEPIRIAVASGKRRVISFFPDVRVRYVDLPEFSESDPASWTFFNINTPEDVISAEAYAHHFSPSA